MIFPVLVYHIGQFFEDSTVCRALLDGWVNFVVFCWQSISGFPSLNHPCFVFVYFNLDCLLVISLSKLLFELFVSLVVTRSIFTCTVPWYKLMKWDLAEAYAQSNGLAIRSLFPNGIGIWKVFGFVERKIGEPVEKPSEQAWTNNKIHPLLTPGLRFKPSPY